MIDRRSFLASLAAAPLLSAAPPGPRFVKSICSVIFPAAMPVMERFAPARSAGFDAIELRIGPDIPSGATDEEVERIGDAAAKAGLKIGSMWVSEPLSANPLNHPSPEIRARGVAAIVRATGMAKIAGCGALLLYPGRLGAGPKLQVGYETTWERFTTELKKALPAAEKNRVLLTPENVWNKFLVSPLEMRTFIDQFHSPWIQSHFDIGNVMQFGYPQDWILTLGSRIKRIHVKDYKLSAKAEQGRFVDLLEGDVDWKEVMAALVKVDYRGFLSPEIGYDPNQPDQLKKVSAQLDKIISFA